MLCLVILICFSTPHQHTRLCLWSRWSLLISSLSSTCVTWTPRRRSSTGLGVISSDLIAAIFYLLTPTVVLVEREPLQKHHRSTGPTCYVSFWLWCLCHFPFEAAKTYSSLYWPCRWPSVGELSLFLCNFQIIPPLKWLLPTPTTLPANTQPTGVKVPLLGELVSSLPSNPPGCGTFMSVPPSPFCSIRKGTPVLPGLCPHLSQKMWKKGTSDFQL